MAVVVRTIGLGLAERVVPPAMVDLDLVELAAGPLLLRVVDLEGVDVPEVPLLLDHVR